MNFWRKWKPSCVYHKTYIHKIAALDHEILNNSMEIGAFITKRYAIFAMFTGTKLTEIFTRFWYNIGKQL